MIPTQQKCFPIAIAMIAIMAVYMLICLFCPSPSVHCPTCNFTPTIYEARQTNYCPECGTRYKMTAEFFTLIGLLITIVGCILIVRKFFLFTSGKAAQYEVSVPGWIVTGVGCLMVSLSSGHYSAICAWAIWFPIVLITKRKEKCKP